MFIGRKLTPNYQSSNSESVRERDLQLFEVLVTFFAGDSIFNIKRTVKIHLETVVTSPPTKEKRLDNILSVKSNNCDCLPFPSCRSYRMREIGDMQRRTSKGETFIER